MECPQYHGDTLFWWMSTAATCRCVALFSNDCCLLSNSFPVFPGRWSEFLEQVYNQLLASIFFALDTTWNSLRVWPLSSSTLQFSQIHIFKSAKRKFLGGIVSIFQKSQRKWRSWYEVRKVLPLRDAKEEQETMTTFGACGSQHHAHHHSQKYL